MKVLVDKENYDQVRQAEKIAGKKIKYLKMLVVDQIDNTWGVYQVIRCYKSVSKYFADMKLVKKTETAQQAELELMQLMNRAQQNLNR